MKCPNCGARCTGRVGAHQHYCWECCVEFNVAGELQIFHLNADGDLIATLGAPEPAAAAAGPSAPATAASETPAVAAAPDGRALAPAAHLVTGVQTR